MRIDVPLALLGFAFTVRASWWDLVFYMDNARCEYTEFTEPIYTDGWNTTIPCQKIVGGSPLSFTFVSDEFSLALYTDEQCTFLDGVTVVYPSNNYAGCMNHTTLMTDLSWGSFAVIDFPRWPV